MEQICGASRMFYSSTQLNSELGLYLSFGLNSYSRADFEQIEIWEIRKSQWIPSLLVHYAIFYFGVTHCKGCTLQASSAMLGWPGEMGATSSSRTRRSSQMASFQFTVVNPLRLWSFFFHQQYCIQSTALLCIRLKLTPAAISACIMHKLSAPLSDRVNVVHSP